MFMTAVAPVRQERTEREKDLERFALEDQIRKRAYELYLERGAGPDRELDDWLQAEEEVLTTTGDLM